VEGILSQDEVDALLEGDSGDAAIEAPAEEGGVRNYNIASQERTVRGRMPTLEIIHERFARNLRIGMFNFMRRTPELSVGPVRVLKYSAFMHDLILPTNLNLVMLKPLRGTALFVFEPTLVFAVIDSMFGGTGKIHTRIEGREFTVTEQRIIQRMLEMTLGEYTKAWNPVFQLELEYVRSEMHPQFANIASPSEIVVATKFDLDLGETGGAMHICVPYPSISSSPARRPIPARSTGAGLVCSRSKCRPPRSSWSRTSPMWMRRSNRCSTCAQAMSSRSNRRRTCT
jgi:flagellar motor switch protein FliM